MKKEKRNSADNWKKCSHNLGNRKEWKIYGLISRVKESCKSSTRRQRSEGFYTVWKNACSECEHFDDTDFQKHMLIQEGFEIKEGDKMKSTQIITTTIVDGRVSVRCVGDVTTPEKMQALATAELIVAEGRDKAGE